MAERGDSGALPLAPWIAALVLLVPSLSVFSGLGGQAGPARGPATAASPGPQARKPTSNAKAFERLPPYLKVPAEFLGIDLLGMSEAEIQPKTGGPPAPGPRCAPGPESEAIDTRAFRYVWGEHYCFGWEGIGAPPPSRRERDQGVVPRIWS